jgi:acyl-CoA thioesterase
VARNDAAHDDAAHDDVAGDGARTAAHEMFDRDLASQGLGIELVDAGAGAAVVRMRVTDAMVNGHGMTHGGFVFLLADTAFALACNSHGPVTVAAGADITFLQPSNAGDVLEARAAERATSGRSGVYDVTVRCDADVVAEFRGRSRVISPGRPS